ncbi:hypothetical protein CLAFUW4_09385 [Fulvia fulva]|uniref:Uncharacterized protein n=1 Tax=Passalora fulva TaxID=5499 RepID=A0A9Q8PGE1_PASFU|nr:uncharacterized protein CLAFUR5_09484 [Fulvia fulva]KAK4613738.1 hypothetical protein CLAFUR4_09391 [Fulvia fulva]KAK4615149.1 hypothetical protein CLAFUR0_09382 [Fulvia fulva]UJO21946.1 hypothetical protein CLAFUR5_09484 [Fulvia fulva]WPV20003.1 hypothetical protein CLAFUW4_09385 [Fulvia fulva]WPV35602.1 hypothetical protein CLAFUW7_09386 [Fulvia fulva]
MQDDESIASQGLKPLGPYQPLATGHVRVLEPYPGLPDSPLVGELKHLRLADITIHGTLAEDGDGEGIDAHPHKNDYEAISYCWRNLDLLETLHFTTGAALNITEIRAMGRRYSFEERCSELFKPSWKSLHALQSTFIADSVASARAMKE